MNNSKLVETLKLFSVEELKSLDQFLSSPYFRDEKNGEELYKLFYFIIQFQGNWNSSELNKEKAYEILYPQESIVKGKLDKLMSSLLREILRFINIHFYKNKENEVKETLVLTKFFQNRKAPGYAQYYLAKAKKLQDKIKRRYRKFIKHLSSIQVDMPQVLKFYPHLSLYLR